MVRTAEIMVVGTELLLGALVDTNGPLVARRLTRLGVEVRRVVAVGDDEEDLAGVLSRAAGCRDVVILAGGLGPTRDDRTRYAVARAAGVGLELRPELVREIQRVFRRFGRPMPESNRVQAELPEGAEAIPNPVGTAPGFALEIGAAWVVALPGVPRELRRLLDEWVLPRLARRLGVGAAVTRVLRLSGLGESRVGEAVADLMGPGRNPYVAILSSPGEVRIEITARADDEDRARELIAPVEGAIRERLGKHVFGADGETHPRVALRAARAAGWTVATVEGRTAGTLAGWLARAGVPGFRGGLVLPSPGLAGGSRDPGAAAKEHARKATGELGADAGLCVAGEEELLKGGGPDRVWVAVWSPAGARARGIPTALGPEASGILACHQALYELRVLAAESPRPPDAP